MGDGPRDQPYDGVTLDLFGTLVDFRTVFNRTMETILRDNGLVDKVHVFRERWQSFVFQGVESEFMTVQEDFKQSLVRVLSELEVKGDLRGYADQVLDGMFDALRRASLFPEVPAVLEALTSVGVPWAILSNIDEEDMHAIIRHHRLRPTAAVSSERVGSYKPDPLIFETAIRELGRLEPARVLHSGDTPSADVVGASAVGMDVYWLNRYLSTYPSSLPRPRYEFPDLEPLPALVLGVGVPQE